jgi:hypothetical protein
MKKKEVNIFSFTSLIISVICLCGFILFILFLLFKPSSLYYLNPYFGILFRGFGFLFLGFFLSSMSLVFGIVSLIQILKRKKSERGLGFCIPAIVLGFILAGLFTLWLFIVLCISS